MGEVHDSQQKQQRRFHQSCECYYDGSPSGFWRRINPDQFCCGCRNQRCFRARNARRNSGDEDVVMPRGPKGEKRAADAIGNAVMIARITTREIEDSTTEAGKNPAALALGRLGGKAWAKGMSAKRRKQIAKKAAESC